MMAGEGAVDVAELGLVLAEGLQDLWADGLVLLGLQVLAEGFANHCLKFTALVGGKGAELFENFGIDLGGEFLQHG
ncbi:MAG: hypothetical protein EBQ80_05325 [Proteobacteria bacterium]|nr:hypothetical protein [Pseudomonadota bacterium]